jgi:hypothetical protein
LGDSSNAAAATATSCPPDITPADETTYKFTDPSFPLPGNYSKELELWVFPGKFGINRKLDEDLKMDAYLKLGHLVFCD